MSITIKRDWGKSEIEVYIKNDGLGVTIDKDDFIEDLVNRLPRFKTKKKVRKALEKVCLEYQKEIRRTK